LHILTVSLEDYFHTGTLHRSVPRSKWSLLESRLEESTYRTLKLLDEHRTRATFFVTGWTAELVPDLLRTVARAGHEIASRGYTGRSIRGISETDLLAEATRSRALLQQVSGTTVLGFRTPQGWLGRSDPQWLGILGRAGYQYDSSVLPLMRLRTGEDWQAIPHWHDLAGEPFLEVPISSYRALGLHFPIGGGNYFRQLPPAWMRWAVERYQRTGLAPHVMYFHTWEMDSSPPRISTASRLERLRQYRNLGQMPAIIGHYLREYQHVGVAEYYGLNVLDQDRDSRPLEDGLAITGGVLRAQRPRPAPDTEAVPVTVVIPCFNEAETLAYLANTLAGLKAAFWGRYRLTFLFVDDGSTDDTWPTLNRLFGSQVGYMVIRHDRNKGVAGAIQSGLERAETEIVCSMDCDCTYDPLELEHMIPMLGSDVAVVTASPYHPKGGVRNVPPWRLVLSKGLSRLYQLVLHNRLHTYTSCFRVYRRSVARGVKLSSEGFFGVTELIGRLDLQGHRIVEYPAVLTGRLLGQSKMKVARTIHGHLLLIGRLGLLRVRGPTRSSVTSKPAQSGEQTLAGQGE
jgi:polysaccharide deacetylase family protein (PEP-CTERM system associated)